MPTYTDKTTVKQYASVRRADFKDSNGDPIFANDTAFDNFIDDPIITNAEKLVEDYTTQTFSGTIPKPIKEATTRISANILTYIRLNQLGDTVRDPSSPSGLGVMAPVQYAVTPDVKMILDMYLMNAKSTEKNWSKIDRVEGD